MKLMIFIFMTIGSLVGGYLPILFGADALSYLSLFTSTIGAIIGIFIGFKVGNYFS